ncbi:hypothetical protein [Parapedobacter indicus]|uniref:Uncharacterized protein n=1 Tax=Parapedobacter indicus TaxID=1477437 RepID=A0A1I3UXU6_9SPHI|nr:hypothetical protein [Parapedobacter indicus]PPK99029.1 hypothetical protein CLV26_11560 [Parapedobacter indicus]SFJ88204.1 hypothetical protein SAMN05444682_115118 [Parapedobacter indicus]
MSKIKRKSEKLAGLAKKVFGEDLVAEAFVLGENYGSDKNNTKVLDKIESHLTEEDDGFVYDYIDCIEIRFCNNRLVRFTNSEWASIHLISE